jgi:uncharacterized protein YxjI
VHSAFQSNHYFLKKQAIALTGIFRIYGENGQMVLYSRQKMFRLREDIRVYSDEDMSQELLFIQAHNIIDFSAAYDVIDSSSQNKVGALRRRGWRSMLRDTWDVLDAYDQPLGILQEDSKGRALLRRMLLGSLLPQNYDVLFGSQRVADLRQKFNPFRYELLMDFSEDTQRRFDRRLGIAAGILLAAIEGRQSE